MESQDDFYWFWKEKAQFIPEFDCLSPEQLENVKMGIRRIYYSIATSESISYQTGYDDGYDEAKEEYEED